MSVLNYVGEYSCENSTDKFVSNGIRPQIWLRYSPLSLDRFGISHIPDRTCIQAPYCSSLMMADPLRFHVILDAWSAHGQNWDPPLLLAHIHYTELSTPSCYGRRYHSD